MFRRVSLTLEVLFAGVSHIPAMAQIEAVARLERAVEAAGGIVSLNAASSTVGRYEPPPPPTRQKGGRQKATPQALTD